MTLRKEFISRSISTVFGVGCFALICQIGILSSFSQAQVILDGTLGGAPGQKVGPGALPDGKVLSSGATATEHLITPNFGMRVGNNLFHSFQDFSIETGKSATFTGPDSVVNVLSRVTGGKVSNIDGILASTIDNANLFLLNPAGIVFGTNAALDVKGAFYTSTADFIQLEDDGRFYVDLDKESVLTMAQPEAFGFLRAKPADIVVNGSFLQVPKGETLSLIGGDVKIVGSLDESPDEANINLSAESGQVILVSVASGGEVKFSKVDGAQNFNVDSIERLGEMRLSDGALIKASGNNGGTVVIRSGNLTIEGASILANVIGEVDGPLQDEPGKGIDIQVVQDVIISNGSVLETSVDTNVTEGVGSGGIYVKADRLAILGESNFVEILSNVAADSNGGNSGDIRLEANSIAIIGDFALLETVTEGSSDAGSIFLKAKNSLNVDDAVIASDSVFASGDAGDIEVTVEGGILSFSNTAFIATQTDESTGDAGNIVVNAEGGGVFLDTADIFTAIRGTGKGGQVQLIADTLELANTLITVDNLSTEQAGGISINVAGSLLLKEGSKIEQAARSSATGENLTITAKDIVMTGGSLISTESLRDGHGGNLSVLAENFEVAEQSRISSAATTFHDEPEASGNAGDVDIHLTGNLIATSGGKILTSTNNLGNGGNINVSGFNLSVINGASVTAGSTSGSDGAGNAGNIQLTAAGTILLDGASITTESEQASGGNIKLDAGKLIQLTDSQVTSRVQEGSGEAGSIDIDPDFIVLQNSRIDSSANVGDGGDVTFVASSAILFDSLSIIDTSSQFGGNGIVDIQAPIQNLSGTIAPLPEDTVPVTALYAARCAAGQGGHFSTFVDSKTDSLSPSPGTFLSSPLLLSTAQAVPNTFDHPKSPVLLTASVVPLVLGQGDPTTACP